MGVQTVPFLDLAIFAWAMVDTVQNPPSRMKHQRTLMAPALDLQTRVKLVKLKRDRLSSRLA